MSRSDAPTRLREWSELPELPLAAIVQLLPPLLRDLLAFASVCRSWRSLFRSLSPSLLPSLPPLLLNLSPSYPLSSPTSTSSSSSYDNDALIPCRFRSPDIRALPFPPSPLSLSLPSPSSHSCLSFSHGHLLFIPKFPTNHPCQPFLADVITGTRILLPPLPADSHCLDYYYNYATLTAPPSSPSSLFLLFGSYSETAVFSCQVSSPSPSTSTAAWTWHRFPTEVWTINHVVSFRDRLYGIRDYSMLFELDLSSDQTHANNTARFVDVLPLPRPPKELDCFDFRPQLLSTTDQMFLVLFVVSRETGLSGESIAKIEVYSLDWKRMQWVQVKRLQDSAICIDWAGKAPVLCGKPESWGRESNCVYVAGSGHDRWLKCNLDEKGVARMPAFIFRCHHWNWPSPIWIYPSLFY